MPSPRTAIEGAARVEFQAWDTKAMIVGQALINTKTAPNLAYRQAIAVAAEAFRLAVEVKQHATKTGGKLL